jgi:zinc/manganese transport system permease protein
MGVDLRWDLVYDVRQMLAYAFMTNALQAGAIVAVVAGAVGWFMVLRRQAFAGHTLAVVGFPGAALATLLGWDVALGYFGACGVTALVLGAATRGDASGPDGEQSAVIGTTQAFLLALGFLFTSLYAGFTTSLNAQLFGSIIGVSSGQVVILLVVGIVCLAGLVLIGRPLLFASVDPAVARARGVPVRALSVAFLLLLGIAAAGAAQITGALLVFALLVAPAATASRLTARPALGLGLSVVIGLVVTWLGESVAFFSPYPIGFWVTTFAFAAFVLATGWRLLADRLGRLA